MLEVAVSPHGLTTVVSGGFSTVLPTRLHCPESFHTPGLLPAHVSVGYRQQNAGLYPGLRPSQQRKNATSRRNYAYDNSYQLVNEDRSGFEPYNITYSYDPLGNRLLQTSSGQVTTYSYNHANELTLQVRPGALPVTTTYDANGNTTLDSASACWPMQHRAS